ncbi:MAG: tRNA (adenosine(37)-N6)-threonylcarbamoyltransferase complex ATPase subunit type 1 TsaE [Rhodothermia bacterium]|nr:tRNA (adenosine(37)-N6)-threonylcarbamoyltransferase complex ATPase subunit type 1 TsaE [Rhodothermia bacterium]
MIAGLSELLPYTSTSIEETFSLGQKLSACFTSGDILALYGEMGAGKTHLAKGLCMGWGIDPESVHSPTFTVINEYAGQYFPIYHFDTYRIEHPAAFLELGFEEYFYGSGICVIEWPERVAEWLPNAVVRLHLTHVDEGKRLIALHG